MILLFLNKNVKHSADLQLKYLELKHFNEEQIKNSRFWNKKIS